MTLTARHATRAFIAAALLVTTAARADLQGDVRAALADKNLAKSKVGVSIVKLSGGQQQQLVEINAATPMVPASNMKVVTTSAALDHLGASFKFQTKLYSRGEDLILVGDGDPTLGDPDLARAAGQPVTATFDAWAAALKKRGITSVRNVVVDDSIFDQQFAHPNWPADQRDRDYVAEVGGLNFAFNCIEMAVSGTAAGRAVKYSLTPATSYVQVDNNCVTGGTANNVGLGRKPGTNELVLRGKKSGTATSTYTVTVHDPSIYGLSVFVDTLKKNGIAVTGQTGRNRDVKKLIAQAPGQFALVGMHETPIGAVLARANKDSANLYAEALCKRLGAAVSGQSGSWANGSAATGAFLNRLGIASTEFTLDDGCGLSKYNTISARAMTRILARDFTGPNRNTYIPSMAIGGVDGTLKKRFKNGLQGRVYAKSGYINGVCTLSGFVNTKSGEWYAFSVLFNQCSAVGNAKAAQEKIVAAIDKASN